MKRILIIKADGQVSELNILPTSREMQKIVGGWIEHVKVVDRVEDGKPIYTSMYVNEEGLVNELPRNQKATDIYQRNIRIQFPNSKNPFIEANELFKKESIAKGFTIVDTTDADYASDPYISGDAIFFEGYTIAEVDALFDRRERA